MIPSYLLRSIQERLMQCMSDLYYSGKDDEDHQNLAHALVHIHDDIEFELSVRELQS